jgi:antitoxin component YwqK of YwqJK toxin-antitoxin module
MRRVDFYRLCGHEFFEALFIAIDRTLGEGPARLRAWPKLNRLQQGLCAWWTFWGDVTNGGLVQYFYNQGDVELPALGELMKASGNQPMLPLLKQAATIYRKHKKAFATDVPFGEDGLFARMTDFTTLDQRVARLIDRTARHLEKWARANITRFALAESGDAIDPTFSGSIETHHANGQLFEQATVRRGVLSGPYCRYRDDGTLEHSGFYAAGELSTNYWPNGQPKHKTLKRGKLKIDEWYFPSGNVQKRFVGDKHGQAVEPIRRWHENGQLAEELHSAEGRKLGPWRKFFADGAPELEAEHRRDGTLIVTNAWDDGRRQVVKNGRGRYVEDGRSIDSDYELFFQSDWIRSYEVQRGIPHGAGTTLHHGVLWSKDHYSGGTRDGECTEYYDNGRLRTRTIYKNGKEAATEQFPKFDDPRPAVLMRAEANAELYAAWKQPLLEVYPTPRNLAKVQAQLRIPVFLQEVHERNRNNTIREEYEDVNTFSDDIAYHVTIDERGAVARMSFSGSGMYSGSSIDRYPPMIKQLKFTPGRSGGRPVRSQAIVWVDHTFIEAGAARPQKLA